MSATKLSVYEEAARLIGDARLSVVTSDVELRYALDDAWAGSVDYVLRAALWRFALKTASLVLTTGPIPGYTFAYLQPTDWLCTFRLFVIGWLGTERPVETRHQNGKFHSSASGLFIAYISENYADPAFAPWPEDFSKLVAAYLAFQAATRIENSAAAANRLSQLFASMLPEAEEHEAFAPDPYLASQLDGTFDTNVAYVLAQGYWRHALKTTEFFAGPPVAVPDPPPQIGYPYVYPKPPDEVIRTHAVFVPSGDGREFPVDVRENAVSWSTSAPHVAVRYVSAQLGTDPKHFPDTFLDALQYYIQLQYAPEAEQQPNQPGGQPPAPLAATFRNSLAAALEVEGEPEDSFYRFERSGAFQRACFDVAESGRWKFAINTVALNADAQLVGGQLQGTLPNTAFADGPIPISPSYSAIFAKPNDWLRTIWIYRIEPGGTNLPAADADGWLERTDIDYRDESGCWSTNWSHIQARYIRRAAVESWRWPQSYTVAVQAWLEYEEVRSDRKASPALVAAKLKFSQDALSKAESHDDAQERSPYKTVGRIVRARYGWGVGRRGEFGRSGTS